MGLFRKTNGMITVFVTLIMVPTVFFTGFLTDLARLKLYGNQAIMTADNYGNAVLSCYDNLLKELYGLFAVAQSDEGIAELDNLQSYMKTSFDPTSSTISWQHLQAVTGTTTYTGVMPYKSATVELSRAYPENANLRNNQVFATQVGDFMKFRIVQCIGDDEDGILDALEEVQNQKNNAEAIEKRNELSEKAEKLFEAAEAYYKALSKFVSYPGYLAGVNHAIDSFESQYKALVKSDEYQAYAAVMEIGIEEGKAASEEVSDYNDAMDHLKPGEEEPEAPSQETIEKAEIYDTWAGYGEDATEETLKKKYDALTASVENTKNSGDITFDKFTDCVIELSERAKDVQTECSHIQAIKSELDEILSRDDVSESIKKGIEADLVKLDDIVADVNTYSSIAVNIDAKDSPVNSDYKEKMENFISDLEDYGSIYFVSGAAEEDMETDEGKLLEDAKLDVALYWDFLSDTDYKKAYESLKSCFGNLSGDDADEYKQKKKTANNMLDDLKKKMEGEETSTDARDIPEAFGYGSNGTGSGFNFSSMMSSASNLFSLSGLEQTGESLLLKFYTVEYDFGMFSSRVTPVKKDSNGETEKKESLTGYEMSKRINYLYGAELEYILNGANSSEENLNAARDKILAFRAVMNFAGTYQVGAVNDSIQNISELASGINPLLGLVVNGALRLAVAGVETYADWDRLKAGEEVYVIKDDLKKMTAYEEIKDLIGSKTEKPAEDNSVRGLKLDYENYVMIMMVFLTSKDSVFDRTQNLIELNVNAAKKGLKEDETLEKLEFKMSDAHTAVDATCTVHMDFVVMPKGFAKQAASDDDYNAIMEFEKNSYKFTVTRGY